MNQIKYPIHMDASNAAKSKRKRKMKVIATKANGIEKVEEFDGITPVSFGLFSSCLKDLSDDDEVACDLSDDEAEKIEAEYGIK